MLKPRTDIALFVLTMAGGGAERIILNLAAGFVGRDLSVDLLVCSGQGGLRNQVPAGVRIVEFRARRPMTSLPEYILYLRRHRPRALLATMTNVNVLAVLGRALSGVDTRVAVQEGSIISRQKVIETKPGLRMAHWLAPILYPRAAARIAVSDGTADDLAVELGLPRDSITRIYNPVITPSVVEQAAEPLSHPWFREGEPPVILAVGRLEPVKDYPTMLRAFAEVARRAPARLLILGEGSERKEVEAVVERLGIGGAVSLPGFVANPFAYMARARLLVLSSKWEGFANVLAEAMSCGVPVVATDCPSGPSEVLANGRYGRLVPVGDEHALAEAMLETLERPAVPADPGWLAQFSLETGVDAYLQALGFSDPPIRAS